MSERDLGLFLAALTLIFAAAVAGAILLATTHP